MEIFPAIDLKDAQVVRLTQGDFKTAQVFASDPLEVAREFAATGARNLHLVDLDGAKDGTTANYATIEKIAAESGLFLEVGGGIRDQERIEQYLSLGVGRVILGTVALYDFDFLCRMLAIYGDKIAVGVDARMGRVAVKGWQELSEVDALEFCHRLDEAGVATIIFTDIACDGTMQGSNLPIYRQLCAELSCQVIASGGISSLRELSELKQLGVAGAILGKALYRGKLDLQEVLQLC